MTTDRAALIAGIAADPDNDLRRLVVADWLEEHGEPERAEFIRLQIEARRTPTTELKPLDARVKELFHDHALRWFEPFLHDLDPTRHVPTAYTPNPGGALSCVIEGPRVTLPQPAYVRGAAVRRGFVELLSLNLSALPTGSSIGAALELEPVSKLSATLTGLREQWKRFSEPGLRHVTDLTLEEITDADRLARAEFAFTDSHLPAVRSFALFAREPDTQPAFRPVPAGTVAVFAASPLAYRVTALTLNLDDAGLRALCRSDRLRLDRLEITGNLTRAGVRALNTAPFAPHLRSLSLNARLPDDALAALASGTRFAALTELNLASNQLTDAGLRSLSAARFLPQLEVLDLSETDITVDDAAPGLRALADAMNLDRLRLLRLGYASYLTLPRGLAARFGDRVSMA